MIKVDVRHEEVIFANDLKLDHIGLPAELVRDIANQLFEKINFEKIEEVNIDSSVNEKRKYKESIEEFLACSTFVINEVSEISSEIEFKGLLSENNFIELNANYRDLIAKKDIGIELKSSQYQAGSRWLHIKILIESSQFDVQVMKIFDCLSERDKAIIFSVYGVNLPCGQSIVDVAKEHNITRAWVYEIIKKSERVIKKKFISAIINEKNINRELSIDQLLENRTYLDSFSPEVLIIVLAKAIYIRALIWNISIMSIIDLISRDFKEEVRILNRIFPIFSSTRMFCTVIKESLATRYSQEEIERMAPLVDDSELIVRLRGVKVASLPFSVRTINCLNAVGIEDADQLARTTIDELKKIPNLGRKCLYSIQQFFDLYKAPK